MSRNDLIVIDGGELDLDELGINYKTPEHDDIYRVLWGVPPGQVIPFEELSPATVGVSLNE